MRRAGAEFEFHWLGETLAQREVGFHGKWVLSSKPREWLSSGESVRSPRVQGLDRLPTLLPTLCLPTKPLGCQDLWAKGQVGMHFQLRRDSCAGLLLAAGD